MKVTQEKLPASQVKLTLEIEAEQTQSVYEQTLKQLSKQVRVSGFRPGKVPRKVLIQQVGPLRIKAQAVEELLKTRVMKAFQQEKVNPIGEYNISPDFESLVGTFEPGQPLSLSVVVEVQPKATLKQCKGFTVQAECVEYDPQQVEDLIDRYRRQLSTLMPLEEDRPAQWGDVAVVDYQGFFVLDQDAPEGAEPEPVPDANATNSQIDLEDGRFIPGFIDGVIGMSVGESRDISATFPDDYPAEELAGKSVIFQTSLNELKVRELPEVNDEFAQNISQYSTIAELREGLETRYKNEAAEKERANKITACVQKLVENVEVELPETYIEQQTDILIRQMASNLSQQGLNLNSLLTPEIIETLRRDLRPNAIDEIKQILGIQALAEQESIVVEEALVRERAQQILSQFDNPKKVDRKRIEAIARDEVTREQCFEWMLENNTIEMVPPGSLPSKDTVIDFADDEPSTSDSDEEAADPGDAEA